MPTARRLIFFHSHISHLPFFYIRNFRSIHIYGQTILYVKNHQSKTPRKYSLVHQINPAKRGPSDDVNESVEDVKKRIEDMAMPQLGMEVPGLDDLITSESKFLLSSRFFRL